MAALRASIYRVTKTITCSHGMFGQELREWPSLLILVVFLGRILRPPRPSTYHQQIRVSLEPAKERGLTHSSLYPPRKKMRSDVNLLRSCPPYVPVFSEQFFIPFNRDDFSFSRYTRKCSTLALKAPHKHPHFFTRTCKGHVR